MELFSNFSYALSCTTGLLWQQLTVAWSDSCLTGSCWACRPWCFSLAASRWSLYPCKVLASTSMSLQIVCRTGPQRHGFLTRENSAQGWAVLVVLSIWGRFSFSSPSHYMLVSGGSTAPIMLEPLHPLAYSLLTTWLGGLVRACCNEDWWTIMLLQLFEHHTRSHSCTQLGKTQDLHPTETWELNAETHCQLEYQSKHSERK